MKDYDEALSNWYHNGDTGGVVWPDGNVTFLAGRSHGLSGSEVRQIDHGDQGYFSHFASADR